MLMALSINWQLNQSLRLLKSSILKEKHPARVAIILKVYSGMRVFSGGRADKKSVHAQHLMSSTAVSSPKRQLPLEMPPSAIARSQCDLTFLPNVPFMQSHTLLDSAERLMEARNRHL